MSSVSVSSVAKWTESKTTDLVRERAVGGCETGAAILLARTNRRACRSMVSIS